MANQKSSSTQSMLISYVCYDADDGQELERTDSPVEIILGNQDVLPALEAQLAKMKPGETRNVTLPPAKAFGPVYDDRFLEVPLEMFDIEDEIEIGDTLEVSEDGEETCPGTVIELHDNAVLVDCNHPMAGRTLKFKLTLVDFT